MIYLSMFFVCRVDGGLVCVNGGVLVFGEVYRGLAR
jgi:hypothetical protein